MTAPLLNILVAHGLEAKPLVRQLGLRQQSDKPHRLFANDQGVSLLVVGNGKQAMAAGTGYLAGLQQIQGVAPAWLNIGIAGHGRADIGSGLLINRVEDRQTGQVYYPTPGIAGGTASALVTVDSPESQYPGDEAYDMEGAAFWVGASYYGVLDLVQLFKVVSDNPSQDVSQFDPEQVSELFNAQQQAIAALVERLLTLAGQHQRRYAMPTAFTALIQRLHFTATQRTQLRSLFRRWSAYGRQQDLEALVTDYQGDARSLLSELELRLAAGEG